MDKATLPQYDRVSQHGQPPQAQRRAPSCRRHKAKPWRALMLASLLAFSVGAHLYLTSNVLLSGQGGRSGSVIVPPNADRLKARCENLKLKPGPPASFARRKESDRFEEGTKPTLIRNATIWTGDLNGLQIVQGDVFLNKGIIYEVGRVGWESLRNVEDLVTYDAEGAWLTPGIVDMHSHIGDSASPELEGAIDDNSLKGVVQPYLRALDGLNTHDDSFRLSISGGVTTSLVLPGSANGIGGQGFVVKLRETRERTPTSKLLEPPFTLNRSELIDYSQPPRWRMMKHACGENPRAVYSNTRMDDVWAFREIYDQAMQLKEKQDAFCSKALNDEWDHLGEYPDDLKYEALVDVLRGRVKVQVHCYEEVDLDDIVRLTNEFKFPIAAFHHAHETYLVPDLLKKAYGHTPATALFATNARYKREAYRGSEFAPRILADNDIPVIMKSDHPVLNSRFLLYEAQQAHYYGLRANLALASVTTTPAQIMGLEHRIGYVKRGYDADLVIWDSHPLALGATPKQVFIDGIQQLEMPFSAKKPKSFQVSPRTPNFDKEAEDAVRYEGLPPLEPSKKFKKTVLFTNVTSLTVRDTVASGGVAQVFSAAGDAAGAVVVEGGKIVCSGVQASCMTALSDRPYETVDLKGGSIFPSLVTFGAPVGIEEITQEDSTSDGYVYDLFDKDDPHVLRESLARAADGLRFSTRDALLGYRAGISVGVVSPKSNGFLSGWGTAFGLSAGHRLELGAVLQEMTAVHISVKSQGSKPSISTQIGALRRLLLKSESGAFRDIADGKVTLVIQAHDADIIASLLALKDEVEASTSAKMKWTIAGATEAHLLAEQLAAASVGVIVNPSRPFPYTWEHRRILPGPPLTEKSAISLLLAHNVTVGIGIEESWSARNTRFDAAWAALEADDEISETQALALVSTNLEMLLGLDVEAELMDLVAAEGGGVFDLAAKVVGVISPQREVVDMF